MPRVQALPTALFLISCYLAPAPTVPWYDFDQAKAKELLVKAGYTVP